MVKKGLQSLLLVETFLLDRKPPFFELGNLRDQFCLHAFECSVVKFFDLAEFLCHIQFFFADEIFDLVQPFFCFSHMRIKIHVLNCLFNVFDRRGIYVVDKFALLKNRSLCLLALDLYQGSSMWLVVSELSLVLQLRSYAHSHSVSLVRVKHSEVARVVTDCDLVSQAGSLIVPPISNINEAL